MLLIAKFMMYIVEAAFLVGIVGSAVVIAITFVEDAHDLKGEE
jgi:hypothetical protein